MTKVEAVEKFRAALEGLSLEEIAAVSDKIKDAIAEYALQNNLTAHEAAHLSSMVFSTRPLR
ncbi:MAG: hypothetical protein AAFP28_13040 [Pseudomonadota bacterium]